MPITDAEIQALKPKKKPYKVAIGGGAYLQVRPDGKKYWRLKYQLDGKESLYSLGVFPKTTLDAAKAARDSVKALIRKGISPTVARREARMRATQPEPLFRLGLTPHAELTIATDTHVITFTSRQTQALTAFLTARVQPEKVSPR
jgi:hypothetical protein